MYFFYLSVIQHLSHIPKDIQRFFRLYVEKLAIITNTKICESLNISMN